MERPSVRVKHHRPGGAHHETGGQRPRGRPLAGAQRPRDAELDGRDAAPGRARGVGAVAQHEPGLRELQRGLLRGRDWCV